MIFLTKYKLAMYYVRVDKDAKVIEHVKQVTVIWNYLPRSVDLVLKKSSLEDFNSYQNRNRRGWWFP